MRLTDITYIVDIYKMELFVLLFVLFLVLGPISTAAM
jgi:hypothetical protein